MINESFISSIFFTYVFLKKYWIFIEKLFNDFGKDVWCNG